jgi:hypothetical protein
VADGAGDQAATRTTAVTRTPWRKRRIGLMLAGIAATGPRRVRDGSGAGTLRPEGARCWTA